MSKPIFYINIYQEACGGLYTSPRPLISSDEAVREAKKYVGNSNAIYLTTATTWVKLDIGATLAEQRRAS